MRSEICHAQYHVISIASKVEPVLSDHHKQLFMQSVKGGCALIKVLKHQLHISISFEITLAIILRQIWWHTHITYKFMLVMCSTPLHHLVSIYFMPLCHCTKLVLSMLVMVPDQGYYLLLLLVPMCLFTPNLIKCIWLQGNNLPERWRWIHCEAISLATLCARDAGDGTLIWLAEDAGQFTSIHQ